MTSPALNNREELDKAVIAAQGVFDRLGKAMNELERLQATRCTDAAIGLAAMEAEDQADWLRRALGGVIALAQPHTAIPAHITASPPAPEGAWVLSFDEGAAA